MKTSIIRIGNSKGIRIPKAILEQSGISGDVELSVRKGSITISAVKVDKNDPYNEEYLKSLPALDDWNRPEEDKAWAHLQ